MKKINAEELLDKYAKGKCNDEEIALLESWYLISDDNDDNIDFENLEKIKAKIWSALPVHEEVKVIKFYQQQWFRRISSIAAILVLVIIGLFYYTSNDNKLATKELVADKIIPGSKKATLTLADGRVIDLTKADNGIIANTNNTTIKKSEDGKISYENQSHSNKEIQWNLLEIPSGGFYNITLSDGTVVWLNAKSSLKYPTEFTAKERIVELKGEGYFEVAHRDKQPFKVISENQIVEVLGTHFNVNSYQDEENKITTLLEGSVKISSNNIFKILKPGFQAIISKQDFKIRSCNAEDAIDWVNNDFIFKNEKLGSIMRKISRWYNIEVSYGSDLENLQFSGSISRNKDINQVLSIMEMTGLLNFKIEGRRVIVTR